MTKEIKGDTKHTEKSVRYGEELEEKCTRWQKIGVLLLRQLKIYVPNGVGG